MTQTKQKTAEIVEETTNSRQVIKELLKDIDSNWFSLSLELLKVYNDKQYAEWGFESLGTK